MGQNFCRHRKNIDSDTKYKKLSSNTNSLELSSNKLLPNNMSLHREAQFLDTCISELEDAVEATMSIESIKNFNINQPNYKDSSIDPTSIYALSRVLSEETECIDPKKTIKNLKDSPEVLTILNSESLRYRMLMKSKNNQRLQQLITLLLGEEQTDRSGNGILKRIQVLLMRKQKMSMSNMAKSQDKSESKSCDFVPLPFTSLISILAGCAKGDSDLRAHISGSGSIGILGTMILGFKDAVKLDKIYESESDSESDSNSETPVPSSLLESLRLLSVLISDHPDVKSGKVKASDPARREKEFERLRQQCFKCGINQMVGTGWVLGYMKRYCRKQDSDSITLANHGPSESQKTLFRYALEIMASLSCNAVKASESDPVRKNATEFVSEILKEILSVVNESDNRLNVKSTVFCELIEEVMRVLLLPFFTTLVENESNQESDGEKTSNDVVLDTQSFRKLLDQLMSDETDAPNKSSTANKKNDLNDDSILTDDSDDSLYLASNSLLLSVQLQIGQMIMIGNRLSFKSNGPTQPNIKVPISLLDQALVFNKSDEVVKILGASKASTKALSASEYLEGDVKGFVQKVERLNKNTSEKLLNVKSNLNMIVKYCSESDSESGAVI